MSETTDIEFQVAGHTLKLNLNNIAFQPTTTTQILGAHMGDLSGKSVLDLGCGTGPIAIAAAKEGAGSVTAVDVMPEAVELARKNAELNGVDDQIEFLVGSLFTPLEDRKFDVILCDVSGMGDEVSRLSEWYPDTIPTGGVDGVALTRQVIKQTPSHLNSGGQFIFPIITLSKYEEMIELARETFGDNLELLQDRKIPFNPELTQHIDRLKAMRDEGLISFTERGSRYVWNLMIFRASVA